MKKIQLLATRPYGHWFPIVSWLIRLTQWSSESHVVLYFPETQKVRHARFNDITEEDIDCFMLKNRMTNMKTILLNDAQFEALDQYSKSKLGKQTGYWSTFIGSFIPQIIRKIGITVINPFYKGLTCSEYFRESIRKADPQLVMVLTNNIPKGIFSTQDALELAPKISK
jgi:hypothetical protein